MLENQNKASWVLLIFMTPLPISGQTFWNALKLVDYQLQVKSQDYYETASEINKNTDFSSLLSPA